MKESIENEIVELLKREQFASVGDIAKELYVSTATVRRKLTLLQKKQLITRKHGGAELNDMNNFSPSFSLRTHTNSLEKKQIALAAIKFIKNGDLIFIDGSTSCFFIADYLADFNDIKVVTNGIDTLSLLSKYNIAAYSTGGIISDTNRSTLVGQIAHNMIQTMHADIAFFSAQSVGKDGEIYDCYEQENYLRLAMMKNASKKILLCDSSKLDKISSYHLCSMDEIDYVVSNADIYTYFGGKYAEKIIAVEK